MSELFPEGSKGPPAFKRRILFKWTPASGWLACLQLQYGDYWRTTATRKFRNRHAALLAADHWQKKYGKLEEIYDDSWIANSIVQDVSDHFKGG
jgi:hypothetical protein